MYMHVSLCLWYYGVSSSLMQLYAQQHHNVYGMHSVLSVGINAVMLILVFVLVLKVSLRTKFKSLSLFFEV